MLPLPPGRVTNALASIKKAPELTGKDTFTTWEPNVLDAISQIGLIGHIHAADDTRDTSFATRPIVAPDEPSAGSSNEHIEESGRYMANDSAVLQILRLRISDNVRISLPSANDRGLSRTARELYAAIKRQYGLGNSAIFKTSRDSLYATMADDMSKVLSYTENYQKQAMTLARANDNLDWSDMIHHFAARLPDSPVISDLKYRLINTIATQHCNVDTFNESTEAITNRMVTWSSNKNPKKSQNGGAEERNRKGRKKCSTDGCNWWGTENKPCPHHKRHADNKDTTTANSSSANSTNTSPNKPTASSSKSTVAAVVDNTILDSAYVACTVFVCCWHAI
ncbi:hypothetical protein PM082_020713 [Marasmius tenuissimus]|nr:hypothetical protein PM082_020713 [Marasmius tenuissimus]